MWYCWFFEFVKPPQSWKNIYFSLFKVYNSAIKIHGPWISKNLGTFIFEKSWTMIIGNSWSMIFKNLRNYVFQFLYFCDKKAGKKTHSWKNIYFSYSKYIILQWWIIAQREEILREILIIFFFRGGFFKFHWSMPQWILLRG